VIVATGNDVEPEPIEEKVATMTDISKVSINKPVDDTNRKTRTKRNREKRNKILQKLEDHKKKEKHKLDDISNIKRYAKEVNAENAAYREQRKQKAEEQSRKLEEQKEGIVFGNKKIGKFRFEQQAVEFQLPEDLPKKLCEVKVDDGIAIRGCYESFIKRGLVQPGAEGVGQKRNRLKRKYKYKERPAQE